MFEYQAPVVLVLAVAENGVIGRGNALPWDLPDDLQHFKRATMGCPVLMGRKTFESFPKLLPNRTHVVITRNKDYTVPKGVIVVSSMEDAIAITKEDSQPFIIGGGEIYTLGIPYADRIELTRVHDQFDADAFFPKIDTVVWNVTNEEFHSSDERHLYAFTYVTYQKKT